MPSNKAQLTSVLVFLLLITTVSSIAQATASTSKLPTAFVQFFAGNWSGKGSFANGKKIAANISCTLILDSNWLLLQHADQPPNRYQSFSLWRTDSTTNRFVASDFTNFGTHRNYTSQGWVDDKLILLNEDTLSCKQKFTYQKLSPTSFKMKYETSKDGMIWKVGDSLIFTKTSLTPTL
jgi:hypothetical protein